MVKNELLKKPDTRTVKPERCVQSGCEAERYPRLGSSVTLAAALVSVKLQLAKILSMVKNELLKKPDTRAVKPEQRVQSGCEAERYPRLGSGGSPVSKLY